jgi:hypothetical protein
MSYASEQGVLNNQWNAAQEANITEQARRAPHVLMRPTLMADGSMWCALYGPDLQVGVAGFGETPQQAMEEFDKAWFSQRTPAAIRLTAPQDAERN